MNEFFSWAMLATFAGASIATAIITQVLKTLLSKIPTQLVSYVIALVVLLLATAATRAAEDWTGWAIVPLNAILVSLASNGTYDAITRATGYKNE
jgi:uncharacterized membrane protein